MSRQMFFISSGNYLQFAHGKTRNEIEGFVKQDPVFKIVEPIARDVISGDNTVQEN